MTATNLTQVALVREVTHGVAPGSPRMRLVRMTGEGLTSAPTYIDSEEIRSDRMNADPAQNLIDNNGPINFEWSYPVDNTFLSEIVRTALWNTWNNSPERDNDGTAASAITAVTAADDTYTVVTGPAFAVGHLVRATGFTNAGNNSVFRAATGSSATAVVAPAAPGLTDEAAPPATARLKVVGFEGAAADITALADGLGSTLLNFTTLGLVRGMWIKIGGTADASTFAFLVTAGAAARRQAWARVVSVTATKLTLDNLPAGWTTDTGTGKTIRVFFSDWIKNGVTRTSLVVERGYIGQAIPSYLQQRGMTGNTMNLLAVSRQRVTGAISFMGLGSSDGTVPLDASPDAPTTARIMSANANVGRINEAGARLTLPNWAREIEFTINNNCRQVEDVTDISAVEIRPGDFGMQVRLNTYFGDLSLRAKFLGGVATSVSSRYEKDGQATVWEVPRCTYREGGNPAIAGRNQDVMLPLTASASFDPATQAHLIINRIEYYEA